MQEIQSYIDKLNQRYKTGISREHSYRGDLQNLLEAMLPEILVTNEPAHIACGAPDYILTKKHIPIGYIEAKDIGKPLNSKEYKEQFTRYKNSLTNLIITDYLQFEFYKEGEKVAHISLANITSEGITPSTENFQNFIDLIQDFATYVGQTLKSPSKLAGMMAGKAKLLAAIIESALNSDEQHQHDSTLQEQMQAFKAILIHDISAKEFADVYAQTIAYGMFAARLHDPTLPTFSRQEAAELIPKSNPFLRNLFQYIAGYDLDERIVWIVDSLADIFRATDVAAILNNFGKETRQNDPIIHFYETFLAAYDPKLRKSRGVWYTPEPVVNFIVRAVDDLLKTDFNLPKGLADTSQTTIQVERAVIKGRGKNKATRLEKIDKDVHKVQILDPATGTGTFLAAVIKHIYKNFAGQQGIWPGYVEQHLIPRLHGFELLMASYAMAHLKLDLLLTETGYHGKIPQRLNVYLTNTLEEEHPDTGTLFATWLSNEASAANRIKREAPVMVVMGNPPYAVSSSNKGAWIQDLLKDYKKDLNERNIQPLSDDYIRFIRYGQHMIDKNGEGILAYISNNSFIDGIIHRQMRKSLLESFDKIYILDLHGNSKKKEVAPDGGKDENVFDIMQGVSINLFVKTSRKRDLAEVYHLDFYGKRQDKYQRLLDSSLASLDWNKLDCRAPEYFFVPKDFKKEKIYKQGISITEVFPEFSSGISTHRDHFVIDLHKPDLIKRIQEFLNGDNSDNELQVKFNLKDNRDWKIRESRLNAYATTKITNILYRPFDKRSIYYDSALIDFPREKVMQHLVNRKNFAFNCLRQSRSNEAGTFLISNEIVCKDTVSLLDRCSTFPLYLYSEPTAEQSMEETSHRTPNLNPDIVKQIAEQLALTFTNEKQNTENTFAPIDLLDYIYAVLHSPTYRETYQEFLKIDFPRVPYPDKNIFWQLVKLGSELRQIHLLESPIVEDFISTYPESGDNQITRKINKHDFVLNPEDSTQGQVWINDQQYFAQVPVIAWNFYIGGYQPAQKWLKDRHGRTLDFDDILHYQKIIVALSETHRIMQKIDKIITL
ncbi:type ISP restriction/modification enzyme [Methyloprofundus sp.]|uniref:type ISP restriction/modification enzyme n=1 Tax=Methyloprofundus sp. TaxID=2020875 RepID=UPI003D1331B9